MSFHGHDLWALGQFSSEFQMYPNPLWQCYENTEGGNHSAGDLFVTNCTMSDINLNEHPTF